MKTPIPENDRPAVLKLMMYQLIAVLLISLVSSLISFQAAYSALLGGLIFVVPNALFIYMTFFFVEVGSARKIANSMYIGEAIKFGLTAVLFAIAFTLIKPLNELTLFVTFFVVLMINSLSPMFVRRPNGS